MAPVFYCKCSNCLCKATVLVTNIEEPKDAKLIVNNEYGDMFSLSSKQPSQEDLILSSPRTLSEIDNSDFIYNGTAEVSLNEEKELQSLIPFIIIILILLGKNI